MKVSFRTDAAEADSVVRNLRELLPDPAAKLVYFDGDDDLGVQWPSVLRACDLYVKKHLLLRQNQYFETFVGKSHLTDYVAKTASFDFSTDPIPCSSPLRSADLDKLHLGWNIALDDHINAFVAAADARRATLKKNVDVVFGAVADRSSWTYSLRATASAAVAALPAEISREITTTRLPLPEYIDLLQRSRMCISPFGFGELCWRDFEAMCCGSLLLKPDVQHLRTEPSLFEPYVTYVPLRWDYSDLGAQVAHFLAHPADLDRIVSEARKRLDHALRAEFFLDRFGELLARVHLLQPRSQTTRTVVISR